MGSINIKQMLSCSYNLNSLNDIVSGCYSKDFNKNNADLD